MKNGIRTSEFWVTVITAVLMEYNRQTGSGMDAADAAMIWGPAAAYVISRGLAKLGAVPDA